MMNEHRCSRCSIKAYFTGSRSLISQAGEMSLMEAEGKIVNLEAKERPACSLGMYPGAVLNVPRLS